MRELIIDRYGQRHKIFIFEDKAQLVKTIFAHFGQLLGARENNNPAQFVALSGGSTPKELYAYWEQRHTQVAVDISSLFLCLGDERKVPSDHQESNVGMLQAMMPSVLQKARFVPPCYHAEHAVMAKQYNATLEALFKEYQPDQKVRHHFDLVLLGVGTDGHTASLFPGSTQLRETDKLVLSSHAPSNYAIRERISLSLPTLCDARNLLFVLDGAKKASVFRRIWHEQASYDLPVSLLVQCRPTSWYITESVFREM